MGACFSQTGVQQRAHFSAGSEASIPMKASMDTYLEDDGLSIDEYYSRTNTDEYSDDTINEIHEIVTKTRKLTHKHTMSTYSITDISIHGKRHLSNDSNVSSLHNDEKVALYLDINNPSPIDYASGQFAHVFVSTVNNKKIAIKKIDVGDWISKTSKKCADEELKLLKKLNTNNGHVNIIKLLDSFYEVCYDDLYLHLVMEFVPSTLYKEIRSYGTNGECIPFKLIKLYSYQILRGLNYINYVQNIIHRDLKPENILIDPQTNIVKICDFGCSKQIHAQKKSIRFMNFYVCSRYYRAPELLLESRNYSYGVDMWSFGCILSELFLGNPLFDGHDTKNQLKEIIKILQIPTKRELYAMNNYYEYDTLLDEYDDDDDNENEDDVDWRFVFFGVKDMPHEAIDLISKILVYDPNDRLRPMDALKHKYFKDLRRDNQRNHKYPIPYGIFDLNDQERKFSRMIHK